MAAVTIALNQQEANEAFQRHDRIIVAHWSGWLKLPSGALDYRLSFAEDEIPNADELGVHSRIAYVRDDA